MTQVTVFTSNAKPLTKIFKVVDGVIEKTAQANFYSGTAVTRAAATPAELLALLEGLSPLQAVSVGALKVGRKARITTATAARKGGAAVARTLEHFHYPEGPGWLLWDYDNGTMPPEVSARVKALGGPLAALFHIWPEAMAAPYLIRPSSSGGVSAPGIPEKQSDGIHGFFLIDDVSRSSASLDVLLARAWAAGLAWCALSKSGAVLIRSIVDAAVGSPERLIFEAAPILIDPVIRTPKPAILSNGIDPVPVPSIDDATEAAAKAAEAEAKRAIKPRAARVEAEFIEDRAQVAAKTTGKPIAEARRMVRQMLKGGVLSDDHLLQMKDGSYARVGDLLDAPKRFNRLSLPDPIEGVSYGLDKATLLLLHKPGHPDMQPRLVSHAHGATTVYRFERYEAAQPQQGAQPTLRPAADLTELLEVGAARTRLRAEVGGGLRRPGVTLIEATLGLGKTQATIGELEALLKDAQAQGIADPTAVVAVPMHRLGRQVLEDIKAAAPGLPVVQLYGAEALDPEDPTQTVCKRLDEYRENAALLLDQESFCNACPFVGSCLHITSAAVKAKIYVVSHERLKAGKAPVKAGQTLVATVVDESPLNALINASSRAVPVAALMAAPVKIRSKAPMTQRMLSEADLRVFRTRLQALVAAHGPGHLRLDVLQSQGWTAGDAKAAAALEWQRKITDEADPDLNGNRTLRTATGIFGKIQQSIEDGIEVNARLEIREGEHGLECLLSGITPISDAYRAAPVLMLDATAQTEVVALLAGEVTHHAVIRARENVLIEQDPMMTGAKSHFFAKGLPTGNVARVRRYVALEALTAKTGVIGNKDTIAAMGLPEGIKTGHFNALRGMNDFADVETLVIVGRTLPSPEALARMVAAIWGTPCAGTIRTDGRAWRQVMTPGGVMEAETKAATHDDPRAAVLLSLIRDAEVTQAIGRLRAVNRAELVRCVLLSDAVVGYPVELVDLRETVWACGVVGEMLERGVAPLSPSQAAAAHPDLYASKQAAAKVFGPIADRATFSIRALYGKGCPVVSVKRARAGQPGIVLIHPSVLDIEAAIKAVLPDAVVLHIARPPAVLGDAPIVEHTLGKGAFASNVIPFMRGGLIDLNRAERSGPPEAEPATAGATEIGQKHSEDTPEDTGEDITARAWETPTREQAENTNAHARRPDGGADGANTRVKGPITSQALPAPPTAAVIVALPPRSHIELSWPADPSDEDDFRVAPHMSIHGAELLIFRREPADQAWDRARRAALWASADHPREAGGALR